MEMGQKRVNKLTELPSLCEFVEPAGHKRLYTSAELLKLLREMAFQLRNGEPRRFYSMRSISDHVRLPLGTVRHAFDQLKAEGFLTACWGSDTTLQPARLNHRVNYNGAIAELVPINVFKADPTCALLAKNISDEM